MEMVIRQSLCSPMMGLPSSYSGTLFYPHFCAVQSRGCSLAKMGKQIENTVCSIFIIFYSRSEGEEVVGLVGVGADKWELLDPSFLLSGYFHL